MPCNQQEICKACGWCCKHDVFRVPDTSSLELYWVRGHRLIYDPKFKGWFVIVNQVCQHYDGICQIYDNRPQADIDWMCPYPDGNMYRTIKILESAAQRILKVKYGGLICRD